MRFLRTNSQQVLLLSLGCSRTLGATRKPNGPLFSDKIVRYGSKIIIILPISGLVNFNFYNNCHKEITLINREWSFKSFVYRLWCPWKTAHIGAMVTRTVLIPSLIHWITILHMSNTADTSFTHKLQGDTSACLELQYLQPFDAQLYSSLSSWQW